MIRLVSCGKSQVTQGMPASLYLDCRIIHNPYRDPILGGKTGDDPVVQDWLRTKNAHVVELFIRLIQQGLLTSGTRNSGRDASKPFTVCFFCLAGVHRSRGMKHVIAQELAKMEFDVEVIA
jgi:RNase adaptor protein for sRNA GlmZ degradation